MVAIGAGIVIVNDNISESVRDTLIRQLFINQVLDGYSFDIALAQNPTLPDLLKQANQRLLVVRSFLNRQTITTWGAADVVVFIQNGLAMIEINNGPPGFTIPVLEIDWGYLLNSKFPIRDFRFHHHHSLRSPTVEFLPGHRFDGKTHQYNTVMVPVKGKPL